VYEDYCLRGVTLYSVEDICRRFRLHLQSRRANYDIAGVLFLRNVDKYQTTYCLHYRRHYSNIEPYNGTLTVSYLFRPLPLVNHPQIKLSRHFVAMTTIGPACSFRSLFGTDSRGRKSINWGTKEQKETACEGEVC
jgi:hypothetical protein